MSYGTYYSSDGDSKAKFLQEEKGKMKRTLSLIALTLAVSGTLVACGNQNASTTPTAPNVAPTASSEPSIAPRSNNIVGNADNALRDAGNAARDAVDGVGDVARGAMEGLEDAARGYGSTYGWDGTTPGTAGYGSYDWNGSDAMNSGSYYSYNTQ